MVFRKLFQCLQQHCIELLEAWNCVRIVFIYKVQIFQRSGVLLLVAVVFQIVEGGIVPSLFLLLCSLAEPLLPSGNGWGVYKRKKGLVKDLFKSMSSGASRANAHITT